jgi:hypothetical protein
LNEIRVLVHAANNYAAYFIFFLIEIMKFCEKCKIGFSKEAQLAKHNQDVHKIAINFICEKCNHICPTHSSYKRHKTQCSKSNTTDGQPYLDSNFDCEMTENDYEISNFISNEMREDFEEESNL